MIDYDLHVHSTFSDGKLAPKEIFRIAKSYRLKGLSVTDHDTIDSVNECRELSLKYEIDYIPGIELSTDYSGYEIHILGYYIDALDNNLLNFLQVLKSSRYERARKMTEKISKQGFLIDFDEILKEAGNDFKSIGRPHVARVLVNKGYYKRISDVFEELIGYGKSAYVERTKVPVAEGINRIINASGIPVLAHPLINDNFIKSIDFEAFVKELVEQGLAGIEVYHSKQTKKESKYLKKIADKYSLLVTGGSDCHGEYENNKYLLGSFGISAGEVNLLKTLKRC